MLQVGLLRAQLVLELRGEVVEKMVPAHAATLATPSDDHDTVLHSSRHPLDTEKSFCLSDPAPRTGGERNGLPPALRAAPLDPSENEESE
ncbi:hypothetical protein GCM10009792_07200 [Microcella alkalica]